VTRIVHHFSPNSNIKETTPVAVINALKALCYGRKMDQHFVNEAACKKSAIQSDSWLPPFPLLSVSISLKLGEIRVQPHMTV